jgi:DNA-directed RNA polymerase subunit RPC12/RpoP
MARTRGLPLGWLRAGFAIASLVGGLGLLAYGACWLIIPAEGETSPAKGSRAVVLLAQCCAAVAGLVTVAAAAGIASSVRTMSPEYRCTACGTRLSFDAVRHVARCLDCGAGLLRETEPDVKRVSPEGPTPGTPATRA